MKNLEQIRAMNALAAANGTTFKGANDGQVVKKIPAMIRENGLLGALAFAAEAKEKKEGSVELKNPGHADVFRAIIRHLAKVGRIEKELDLEKFIDALCAGDAATLRAVTTESLSYLNYLRRFARKEKENEHVSP